MRKLLVVLVLLGTFAGLALADTLVLQPAAEGKDAHVRSLGGTSNYGSYAYLTVNWSPAQEGRGLVQFEGLSAIPAGSTITSAILELYSYANNPNDNYTINRITATWVEMTVTWDNQPAHDPTPAATVLVAGAGTYSWTITALVQAWVTGTYQNYGFKLIRPSGAMTSQPYFCSSDNTTYAKPKLTVIYTPGSAVAPASLGRVKAAFK